MKSSLSQKILLSLLGLAAAGICYTPRQQKKVFREIGKIWQENNGNGKEKLSIQIGSLYRSKLIKKIENKDGTTTIVLTEKGKIRALTYKFREMQIKKEDWDGKWRVIFFDIPEKQRVHRDILREKIKNLGFYELQKSVFVFPYKCENEIEFLIEFYKISKWVRFGILEKIDNDVYLKKFFNIK